LDTRASQQPRATRTSIPSGCARSSEASGCTRSSAFLSHEPSSTKGRKGWGDRRQGGRSTPVLDGKSFTVDGLREKLREFYREEVRAELRAVASLKNVELITALISCNRQLGLVGLQLRILNGVVRC
jgi:hypothetical protein